MPEILVISGKGGTGKTSLTAAFAHLAEKAVICDLDVDAPDLHLLLAPDHLQVHEFWSGHRARIVPAACSRCGLCRQICRFRAVIETADGFDIDPLRCEGCKACVVQCPEQAVEFIPKQCGQWYVSRSRLGAAMVHAQLFPGEENSGRLVALLRREARQMAQSQGTGLILADGPPGIGCPVISSLSGVDLAVLVTEPTSSGRHDLERVAALCDHFKIKAAVVINKWDLNNDQSREIRAWCQARNMAVVAQLPHDPAFVHAMVAGRTITEFAQNGTAAAIQSAWQEINGLAAGSKKQMATPS